MAGGAAIGAAAGYAIGRPAGTKPPATAIPAPVAYFICYEEIFALRGDTGAVRWQKPVVTDGGAAADGDGIYVSDENGYVTAFDAATGAVRWTTGVKKGGGGPPLVYDNTVYVQLGDQYMYAIDTRTGHIRWRQPTAIDTYNPPIFYNGIVYAGSPDSYVYALDAANGKVRWRFGGGGQGAQGQMTVAQGTVFAAGSDHLYALDAGSGDVLRTYSPDLALPCANGVSYNGSTDGASLKATDLVDSKVLWTRAFTGVSFGSGITAGNVAYLPVTDDVVANAGMGGRFHADWVGRVIALDTASGRTLWSYSATQGVFSPVISGDILYFSCGWSMFALDAVTGRFKWIYTSGSSGGDIAIGSS